jgi:hypothetical protein
LEEERFKNWRMCRYDAFEVGKRGSGFWTGARAGAWTIAGWGACRSGKWPSRAQRVFILHVLVHMCPDTRGASSGAYMRVDEALVEISITGSVDYCDVQTGAG